VKSKKPSSVGLREAVIDQRFPYARRFIVNHGDRSGIEQKPDGGALSHLALS